MGQRLQPGCSVCQTIEYRGRDAKTLADPPGPAQIAATAESSAAHVAFTYNDPVIFAEYAIDIADACRERGIHSVAVSAGYMSAEPRREFYEKMDAVNVDLKAFTEQFYKKIAFAELAPVLETLEYIYKETRTWLEITTLLIPGHNDSDSELDQLSQGVTTAGPEVPLHFRPSTRFKMPTSRHTARPSPAPAHRPRKGAKRLYRQRPDIAEQESVRVQGRHPPGWYQILEYRVTRTAAPGCNPAIDGRFHPAGAGTWGRKRLRVWIRTDTVARRGRRFAQHRLARRVAATSPPRGPAARLDGLLYVATRAARLAATSHAICATNRALSGSRVLRSRHLLPAPVVVSCGPPASACFSIYAPPCSTPHDTRAWPLTLDDAALARASRP